MTRGCVHCAVLKVIATFFDAAQAHCMGCLFYFIARVEGFSDNSWAGAEEIMVEAEPWERCVNAEGVGG
eukprot:scaffold15199_cov20-Tisochrysis_lutea.AAC.2